MSLEVESSQKAQDYKVLMYYSSAFLHLLLMLTILVVIWKYYKYYLRQKRAGVPSVASDAAFDQYLPQVPIC